MNKELLQRYVEGNVTSEEVEIVVDWLDQDEANVREFMALHKLNDISLFNRGDAKRTKRANIGELRKIGIEILKIAAIFLLVWGVKDFITHEPVEVELPVTYQTIIVPAGQRAEVILPDSSRVWLNANTEIVYPTQFAFGHREIKLNGEAYFDVKHNPSQPFLVKTEKIDIQVLGTEFNVLAYAEKTVPEVTLLNGSVEVKAKGISVPYTMNVNEQLRLEDGKLYVSPITQFDYFKWKEGILCFHNESVESIMKKLELYFDVRIDVRKAGLLKHRYTGKFRVDDGVEQVLKVLQLEHQFTYARDHELNLITIK
ncbi:MAG: FecR domain-containing protein [Tannerellaceae bacterium]|jgi:ferric-dicitrate binding protein FerR (iron transport regulator)|nr:FecR domain-containing protein [Tannerellaceae bacterium]